MRLQLDMALVRSSLGHGVVVMRQAWRRFWPLMLILSALNVTGSSIDSPLARLICTVLGGLLTISLYGALFRIGDPSRDLPHPNLGRLGIQFRDIEARLMWAYLGKAAILVFLGLLLVVSNLVLAAIIAYGRGHELTLANPSAYGVELGPVGLGVLAVTIIISILYLMWLSMRLYLVEPASAYERQPQILATLPLTRGKIKTLAVAIGVVWVGYVSALIASAYIGYSMLSSLMTDALMGILESALIFVVVPFDTGVKAALYRSLKAGHNQTEYPLESGEKD